MKAIAFALLVLGYAALYSGASNITTGGQGWGFLQSLLNNGSGNSVSSSSTAAAAGNAIGNSISNGITAAQNTGG